jgi:hypothetical protein
MNGLDDDDGCPDRGVVRIESNELSILESIQFEPDSVDIGRAAHPILDAIAATLQGNPGIRAEVHGHAAPNEASPYLIAAERAGAVREALIARGVAPHRLVVRGFGATRPIDPRTSPDASARNRRVSFSVAHDDERLPNTGVTARAMSRQRRGLTRARTGIGGTRYVIGRRIDVPAGRSALVPAVNVDVTAEEVFLFRPDPDVPRSDESPYRAARVDNASEIDLVPGPVALYGRGGLLGQGLLDGLRAGEDVIIPWELDDSTRVRSERREDSAPVAVLSVSGSRAVLRREVTERVTYTVRVGRHAPRQMLVHHEIHSGGTLVSPPPGTTRGDGFALVPLPIADSESSILEVVETRFVDSSIDLRQDISLDLEDFVSGTTMTPEDRLRFDEIRRDRAALRQSDAQTRALSQRLSEHGVRSAEIRAALESLPDGPSVAAVRRRLAEQLLASVTDGEAISRELGALRASEIEARGRLRAVAAGFTWPLRQDDALAAASEGGSEE